MFFPDKTAIQGLFHLAQAMLGYFLAWFQSPQMFSAVPETPLATKRHGTFKVLNCKQIFPVSCSDPYYPTYTLARVC
jgi:hypothetical protein